MREFYPYKEAHDNYQKYIVTLSKYLRVDDDGIKGIHLKDFLLKKSFNAEKIQTRQYHSHPFDFNDTCCERYTITQTLTQ
jgi:hypothetical protein